jgi:aspartyl-tRNA(Asn)/glutamyl-tRNA(Gln) amidotransferase subunit C
LPTHTAPAAASPVGAIVRTSSRIAAILTRCLPMALTENDVARIAHLARIEIGADERRAMLAQLNDIFAMIEKMQAVETTGVAPMAHPLGGRQRLREDLVTEGNARDENMKNAPEAQDGLFLVPRVVE